MPAPVINVTAYSGDHPKKLLETVVMNSFDVQKDTDGTVGENPYKRTLTKLKPVNGARPYRLDKDYVNSPVYSDRILEVKPAKKDFQIEGEKYMTTYLNLAKRNKLDPDEIPYWDFHLMMEIKSFLAEINDSTAYLGVHNAAGANAVAIADGFGTILAALITATTITPETLGTIDDTNAVEQFQTLYRSMPNAWRNSMVELYCSYAKYDAYRDNLSTAYNIVWNDSENPDTQNTQLYLPKSNRKCRIIPASWMGNSDRVIITPRENFQTDVGTETAEPTIEMIRDLSCWNCRLLFRVGFQIADTEAIFCNESA